MKNTSVTSKIKFLGAMLFLTLFFIVGITIYLNEKNMKDASIINIAGKQRMLSQRIVKDILFSSINNKLDKDKINSSKKEFEAGLNYLLNESVADNSNLQIKEQLLKVSSLWQSFKVNVNSFLEANTNINTQNEKELIMWFERNNEELLNEMDKAVNMYQAYFEEKTTFIKYFQYLSMLLLFLVALYVIKELKAIQKNAYELLEKSKDFAYADLATLKPLEIEGEKEFVEVADSLNSFISRVHDALNVSENALNQSNIASNKILKISDDFDEIISSYKDKKEILDKIDKSEDIIYELTEDLNHTNKKIEKLRSQLSQIIIDCK